MVVTQRQPLALIPRVRRRFVRSDAAADPGIQKGAGHDVLMSLSEQRGTIYTTTNLTRTIHCHPDSFNTAATPSPRTFVTAHII